MALITCPECNHEVSDTALACPHCGYQVKKDFESPQQVEVTSIKIKPKISKKILFLASIFIIITLSVVVGTIISNKNKEALREKEYIENLNEARSAMLVGAAEAEQLCNLTKSVWYNTIYKKNDSETDKYTTTASGKFHKDFNTSLSNLYESDFAEQKIKDITKNQDEVSAIILNLKNPPEEYSEEHKTINEMYDVYLKFTNHSISPSGSLTSYSSSFSDYDTTFMQYYDKIGRQITIK